MENEHALHVGVTPPPPLKKGRGIEKKTQKDELSRRERHEPNIDSDNIVIIKARTPGVASVVLERCDSWWNIELLPQCPF